MSTFLDKFKNSPKKGCHSIIELIVTHNNFNVNTIFLKMWGKSASTILTQTADTKILQIFKEKIKSEIEDGKYKVNAPNLQEEQTNIDGMILTTYDLKEKEKLIDQIKTEIEQKFDGKTIEKINTVSIKHELVKKEGWWLRPSNKKCTII